MLDAQRRQVRRDGLEVRLSPKAFDLLKLLAEHDDRAFSKSELHEHLWPKTFVSDGSLTILIAEIRNVLGDNAQRPKYVRTVQRFGYAFCTKVSTSPTQRPKSGPLVPNNLPKERTRFIGRETELAQCARLFAESRLLTITGIGGSGKTRLAIRLAESLLQSYPDGIWFVDLSPLRDASRVAEAIGATFAVSEEPGKGLLETLVHHVREKRLMLVLDNCEHLLDACGALVDALLRTADDVQVLATSRESLGIQGERIFSLRPLGVPSGTGFNLEDVKSSEAVRLFMERAQIVDRAFVLDAQSAQPVGEICRRLDGIPLAIELAAARVKMLSVDEINSRLDDRLRLLTGGKRALPRHQTLRAAFQWSYDLLTLEEQRLFRLLAVFAGGWTLEAATAVWSKSADQFEVLDLMTYLVDKSLVTIERLADGTTRYRMLETSRQFAQEKLDEVSESEGARARHLKYFVAWEGEREGTEDWADEGGWFKQGGQEYENLLLALETSARTEDGARHGLRLAHHMGGYWTRCGMYGIGRERTGAALQRPGAESPTPERAAALASMGHMAWKQDAQAEARTCYEESLALSRKYGNAREVIRALNGLGFVYFAENDPCAAQACFEEALALALARERRVIGVCLNGLALLAWERDDLAQARAHWEDALAALRGLENRFSIDCRAVVATNLNNVALRNNAWEEVRSNLREALPIVCSGLRGSAIPVLEQLASLASVKGEAMRAARWFGAAAALERAFGSKQHFRRESSRFEERLREKMGAATFTRVAAEGGALGYEEALAEAQVWLEDPQRWVHHI
jgi:non-specific serine/threonine protein kinase